MKFSKRKGRDLWVKAQSWEHPDWCADGWDIVTIMGRTEGVPIANSNTYMHEGKMWVRARHKSDSAGFCKIEYPCIPGKTTADSVLHRDVRDIDPGYWRYEIEALIDRIQDAMRLLCDARPPRDFVEYWLSGDENWVDIEGDHIGHPLQDWAASHAKRDWMMGIGVIEAAIELATKGSRNDC